MSVHTLHTERRVPGNPTYTDCITALRMRKCREPSNRHPKAASEPTLKRRVVKSQRSRRPRDRSPRRPHPYLSAPREFREGLAPRAPRQPLAGVRMQGCPAMHARTRAGKPRARTAHVISGSEENAARRPRPHGPRPCFRRRKSSPELCSGDSVRFSGASRRLGRSR